MSFVKGRGKRIERGQTGHIYVFIQTLQHAQDKRQVHFWRAVQIIWIQYFSLVRILTNLKIPVYPTIYPQLDEKILIHDFLKSISTKWNAVFSMIWS